MREKTNRKTRSNINTKKIIPNKWVSTNIFLNSRVLFVKMLPEVTEEGGISKWEYNVKA